MKRLLLFPFSTRWAALVALMFGTTAHAVLPPIRAELPNFDRRMEAVTNQSIPAAKLFAKRQLQTQSPRLQVEFDLISRSPKWVCAPEGFLTGAEGQANRLPPAALAKFSANDPYRTTKAFVEANRNLFGHGPEALEQSSIRQEYVTPHNGMRTTVWEQQVDGVPLFEAVFIAHTTRQGDLVNVASQFVPDPVAAADRGVPQRAAKVAKPKLSARRAAVLAAKNIGLTVKESEIIPAKGNNSTGPEKRQSFQSAKFKGAADVKLIWLPMDAEKLRLCWDVTVMSRERGEMYRVLLDAQTGEVFVRHCLTDYISDATYRVYTSDSPSPFSPSYSTPVTTQPAFTNRVLITLPALDTNASPNGWIDDGVNETTGNNVDAHTDLNADNIADLPRPHGSPNRVFDFPLDLTQAASTYTNAAVVQLFYWNNFMHDKLYQLGFTEAAGNFQNSNFGRGGAGNDAVQADAQDGSGVNNANFSTPADGSPGRMQMYVFSSPSPNRDGDLDAEVVLHEYTHGLSNRRVGGGVGISASQTAGMGEGWSDFYAMALLSEATDDVNAVYAYGGYVTYQLSGLTQNYYYGIRRYPYCTDMNKNPLTFKDIDPAQASSHAGVSRSPIIGNTANEVHNMGEVWCSALREARANLINKYGWATGNQLMLQLVTDGMTLSPANPNFVQARDAIIQADLVDTGGANRSELWAGFAKRGLGLTATSPASSTTTGVHEAFDLPDALGITPAVGVTSSGPTGGPFNPSVQTFTLTNTGLASLNWSLGNTSVWFAASPSSGVLAAGGGSAVNISILPAAASLPGGSYAATVWFTNTTSSVTQTRTVTVNAISTSVADNFDPGIHLSQWSSFGGTVGSTVVATNYGGYVSSPNSLWFGDAGTRHATTIPINTSAGGTIAFALRIANGASWPWEYADIPAEGIVFESSTNSGVAWTVLGTYNTTTYQTWTTITSSIPASARSASTQFRWRQLSHSGSSFDHWAIDNVSINATPPSFLVLSVPASATEGDGVLSGSVSASSIVASNLTVNLSSSDTTEVTVPATVTIPAGQSNVLFNLNIVDDTELDGTQTAIISATATGFAAATASLAVADNETAVLSVTLPPTAIEGQGTVNGNLQLSATPTANIAVTMTSSDTTEILVPTTVFIPAGQTTAVFTATVVDDNLIDGPQTALITAHVQNWTDGTTLITVLDNEATNLIVTLPVSVQENAGVLAGAGSVKLSGVLTNNLVVSLLSSVPGRLTAAPSVTIPAGQTSNTFNLTPVDNNLNDGNATVNVTASAAGFSNGSSSLLVVDDDLPPTITAQPVSQTVYVPQLASLSVGATGKNPLFYQWRQNGTNITGGTNAILTFASVQLTNAGTYSVVVSNAFGQAVSSNAVLSVLVPVCSAPPSGLVAWWRGEGDATDAMGNSSGTLLGGGTYSVGKAGQAFSLNGTDSYVSVPDSPLISSLSNRMTVELWLKSSSTNANPDWQGVVTKGNSSWRIQATSGQKTLSVTLSGTTLTTDATGTRNVNDGQWHHVAMVYDGTNALLYVDAALDASAPATGSLAQNSDPLCIGANAKAYVLSCACVQTGYFYKGAIDEVSLYNRALSSNEVAAIYNAGSAGKCYSPQPAITTQPAGQSAYVGGTASFGVVATGNAPLNYQWRLNGVDLPGANNPVLNLGYVQMADAGSYSVVVSNAFGAVLSSNALLSVYAHHFGWDYIPSPQTAKVPFNVSLAALDVNGSIIGDYGGSAMLTAVITNLAGSNTDFEAGSLTPWTPLNLGNQPGPYDLVAFDVNGDGIASTAFRIAANSGTPDGITQNVPLVGGATYSVKMDIATDDSSSGNNADGGTTAITIGGTTVAQFSWGFVNIGNIYRTNLTGTFTPTTNGVYPVNLTFYRGYGEPGNLWCLADDLNITGPTGTINLSPTNAAGFVNGLWTGPVNLLAAGTNITLIADDAHGHTGVSNPFDATNPVPPLILVHPAGQTALGGTDVTFSVVATGTEPLSFVWLKNAAVLPGQATTDLFLPAVTRTNSGTYSVIITNVAGSATSSNAILVVHVPQQLGRPVLLPDGKFILISGDADGGTITPADLPFFHAQSSTNLIDWVDLPGALSITNGGLQLNDPSAANQPLRFYRIMEN